MPNPVNNTDPAVGTGLIHVSILEALARLWEGPLKPPDLPLIELALRALLTSKSLSVLRISSLFGSGDYDSDEEHLQDDRFTQPFRDPLLDYEFVPGNIKRRPLSSEEQAHITRQLHREIVQMAFAALPSWIANVAAADIYIDYWYEGRSIDECKSIVRILNDRTELEKYRTMIYSETQKRMNLTI